jgi:PAS domain S-box-containing protein
VLDLVPDTQTGLRKVAFGLVDAFVSDLPVATYWMEREGITNLQVAGASGYVYRMGISTRKDWPELNRILDKGLALITPEERTAIYQKWVKMPVEPALFSRRLGLVLLGGLGVAGLGLWFVLGWNRSLATQVKQRTAALQQSEELFRSLTESTSAWVFIVQDLRVCYVNAAAETGIGYARAELVGQELWPLIVPEDRPIIQARVQTRLHGLPLAPSYEARVITKAGEVRWLQISSKIIPYNNGVADLSTAFDITQRKRAELALQQSEEMFRSLTETTSAWVYIVQNNRLCYVNSAAVAGTEYAREELVGNELGALVHPHDWPAIQARRQARKQGQFIPLIYEARAVTKTGRVLWFQVASNRIAYNNAPAELCTAIDITDRKLAQEALQQSEEMFRSLTESTSAWVFIEQNNRCSYVNSAIEAGTGYTRDELAAMNIWELVHPDQQQWIRGRVEARQQGLPIPPNYEARVLTKAGENRWLQITTTPIEYRQASAVLGTAFDITDRKQAEEQLKVSEQQLRQLAGYLQTAREEERTSIAREIHDELGQAMTAMKMDLSWLVKRVPEDQQPVQERLRGMIELVSDTITTVRRLATQLRPGILDDLGLHAALEWQAHEFQTRTGIGCDFVAAADVADLAPERATAIFRICQEALTNVARHAHATSVHIRLWEEAKHLLLEVQDNGRGISTNETAQARSFGLLGMQERAFLLGGEFQLTGSPNNGTTVTARIPRAQARAKGGAS